MSDGNLAAFYRLCDALLVDPTLPYEEAKKQMISSMDSLGVLWEAEDLAAEGPHRY